MWWVGWIRTALIPNDAAKIVNQFGIRKQQRKRKNKSEKERDEKLENREEGESIFL